jgi:2-polyprenyl-6-methoxyphenol hydroxylase-like FAD-dependent oxidoreductase
MAAGGYDVIVVGARVAGAATALLLARCGLRVLAVDRSRFPSDTLSTHQIQVPGVARLHRWGLLDRLAAAGTPATREVRFDPGPVVLDGRFPPYQGVDALYSPRRTVLDLALVEAARDAGAEVRENYLVEELVWADGTVVGIRGHERGRAPATERARLVVGADGKHSLVARAVAARCYRERPATTLACYTYWSGIPGHRTGELYQRPGRAVAAFPTNDGLTMVYVAAPLAELPAFRADVAGRYLETLDRCGDIGQRVREGRRAERWRTTPDLPGVFRVPYGPGWALVGDAGLVMDPVSAQGIGNALRDAQSLAEAVACGLSSGSLAAGLAGYHRNRDRVTGPMYDFTARLATLAPPNRRERALLAALVGRPAEIDRMLGVFAGTEPVRAFFSPRNALRLLGPAGVARLVTTGTPT